jgi:hypothetical protein
MLVLVMLEELKLGRESKMFCRNSVKIVLVATLTAAFVGPCVKSNAEKTRVAEQQRSDFLDEVVLLDEDKRIAFATEYSIYVTEPLSRYSERKEFKVGQHVNSLVWGSDNALYFAQKNQPDHYGDCTVRYDLKRLCLHDGTVRTLLDSCGAGFSEITHLRIDDDRLYFKTGAGCASVKTNGSDLKGEDFLHGSDQVVCPKSRHDLIIRGRVYIRRGDAKIDLGHGGNIAVWECGR